MDSSFAASLFWQAIGAAIIITLGVAVRLWISRQSSSRTDYADQKYWDMRYKAAPKTFEWYDPHNLDRVKKALGSKWTEGGGTCIKVLDVGCGNSTFGERLANDESGDQRYDVTGIDFSPHVIRLMRDQNPKRASCYQVMDASSTPFRPQTFHAAFDKGTIDGLLQFAATKPRNLRQARRVAREIARVLKKGGTFVSVSILNADKWSVCLGDKQQQQSSDATDTGDRSSGSAKPDTVSLQLLNTQKWAVMQGNPPEAIAVYMHTCCRT